MRLHIRTDGTSKYGTARTVQVRTYVRTGRYPVRVRCGERKAEATQAQSKKEEREVKDFVLNEN